MRHFCHLARRRRQKGHTPPQVSKFLREVLFSLQRRGAPRLSRPSSASTETGTRRRRGAPAVAVSPDRASEVEAAKKGRRSERTNANNGDRDEMENAEKRSPAAGIELSRQVYVKFRDVAMEASTDVRQTENVARGARKQRTRKDRALRWGRVSCVFLEFLLKEENRLGR
ncbi:hypothetical protein TGP89_358950 [Toxoplasma gondii p89]|uniref:Uncharacterized protein n=2 Tax=Toxoplasma gondii TaxID=5811 RepID=A0A2T6ITM5_TOXGO|nr:hypothetical protein TGP89_358950 [Toxoplasma gondii p89]PUA88696.1 hypothetical protein TGBR9_358950 [Toxoplasma gondii TgCATBr9]